MSKRLLFSFRLAILAAGLAFTALGVWRGEMSEIMRKAVVVCLECIGIG
jgi:hypothetical protein